jgi:hypothetical protein
MDNAFAVGVIERVGDGNGNVEQLIELPRPADDRVSQGLAIEEFHRDKGLAFVLSDFVDGANVGMVQG